MSVRIIKSEDDLIGDSSYLSCFDPYVQRALSLSPDFVRRRFFIECLMNDRVFTSISHILGSAISFNIIKENKILLEKEIVIPYSREYSSVFGVVKDRLSRYDFDKGLYRKWHIPISKKSYLNQVFNEVCDPNTDDIKRIAEQKEDFLGLALRCVVSHSPLEGMGTFKKELLRDLKDFQASIKTRKPKHFLCKFIEFIDETVSDRMNRNLYFSILENSKLPPEIIRQLLNINILNYQVGYLSNLRWQPVLNPLWSEEIYVTQFDKKPYLSKKAITWGKSSFKALEELIQGSSIPVHFLDSLTANSIIELRDNPHLRSFRHQVKQIITELLAPTTETYQEDLLKQTERIGNEVINAIRGRIKTETHSMDNILAIRNVLYTISLFAAGTLRHPALLILLFPPIIDILTKGGLTHEILYRTHKYDLVFLKHHLEKIWLPRLNI